MPYKMPAHIFDLDDATAERLTHLTIRRRLRRRAVAVAIGVAAFAASALAATL